MDNLNRKEKLLFEYIREYYRLNGTYPTYNMMMESMEYKSKRSISILIDRLIEKEYINKNSQSQLRLTKSLNDTDNQDTVNVPLLGEIACGQPIFAEQFIEATYAISTAFINTGEKYFLLRAQGDSMNDPKGNYSPINSGDLLLVRVQPNAENGQRVVALVNNEATVKEFCRMSDHIVLKPQSDNPRNAPIILTEEFQIQGVVERVFPDL